MNEIKTKIKTNPTTNQQQMHPIKTPPLALAHLSWRVLLATLVLALTAAGCSNRNAAPVTPAAAPVEKRGDWFCQPAIPGASEPWECVQDKALAKNPKPDRLPNASDGDNDGEAKRPLSRQPTSSPIDIDADVQKPQIDDVDLPLPDNPPPPPPPGLSQRQSSDPPEASQSAPTQHSATATNSTSAAKRSSPPRPLPDYIRLAYQPTAPVSILELPSHFYAVQLTALSSAEDIQAFIAKHELNNLTAAKVSINGKLRYVLILGIYESREKAELAAAGQKPAPLASFTPWIRKLSNLQKAMHEANQRESA